MKLLRDTLTNEEGRYSSKRLTAFYCFFMATIMVIIDVACLLLEKQIQLDKEYFKTFLWFGSAVLGLNVASGLGHHTLQKKKSSNES